MHPLIILRGTLVIISEALFTRTGGMRMRDAQLIRRIQAGDRAAGDTLIERYYAAILRYCARHTACIQTAEDLTQEVFLHLFRTIGSYREQGQFRAYLYRIAYCLCVDAARQRKTEPLPEDMTGTAAPFEAVENRDMAERLLASLPPEQREAVWLRYGEGLKYREIAAVTGQRIAHRAEPCTDRTENFKGGKTVNSSALHRLLCQGPQPSRIAETKQKCAALLQENPVRQRTGVLDLPLPGVALYRGAHVGGAGGGVCAVFPGSGRTKETLCPGCRCWGRFWWGGVCRSCLPASASTWTSWKHPPVCPVRSWRLPS